MLEEIVAIVGRGPATPVVVEAVKDAIVEVGGGSEDDVTCTVVGIEIGTALVLWRVPAAVTLEVTDGGGGGLGTVVGGVSTAGVADVFFFFPISPGLIPGFGAVCAILINSS